MSKWYHRKVKGYRTRYEEECVAEDVLADPFLVKCDTGDLGIEVRVRYWVEVPRHLGVFRIPDCDGTE